MTEILNFLDTSDTPAWVVCKYLEHPLLLPGRRKFDLRCMVLLCHDYSIYLYSEGVLRTCSVAYSMDDLNDRYAHLANHCLQKDHPNYGSFEDEPDNLMSYAAFKRFLSEAGHGDNALDDHILPQIERQVVYSLLAARDQMEVLPTAAYSSFNLLGYDFM